MRIIGSIEELNNLLQRETILLTYFGNKSCSVCHATKPKVEALLKEFPGVLSCYCPADRIPQLAGQHLVFAVPAVILFFQGKEVFRSARFIDLDRMVDRLKELSDHVEISYGSSNNNGNNGQR